MKVVPLSKAKARLSYYSSLCHKEPIIVTVSGIPSFEMVPLEDDDDLIDRLIERNPKFRQYLEKCLPAKSISVEEALKRLK